MFKHHLPELICPRCSGDLALEGGEAPDGHVEIGRLRCEACNLAVPIEGGIPRFAGEAYAANFSRQWKQFVRIDQYYDLDTETYYARGLGLSRDDVAGKRVLDVGCGSGRGVGHFLRGAPKLLVAVDLSRAVEAVQEQYGEHGNLLVVQADLVALPLPLGSFDIVYSYGVIHHTPDPAKYFARLAEYVSPGGRLAVYLYRTGTIQGIVSRRVQRNSHRLPASLLVAFCYLLAGLSTGLYWISTIPFVRFANEFLLHAVRFFFRVSPSRHFWFNFLHAHDFHTTRYVFEFEPAEVYSWFERAGFHSMRPLRGSGMIGTRCAESVGVTQSAGGKQQHGQVPYSARVDGSGNRG